MKIRSQNVIKGEEAARLGEILLDIVKELQSGRPVIADAQATNHVVEIPSDDMFRRHRNGGIESFKLELLWPNPK